MNLPTCKILQQAVRGIRRVHFFLFYSILHTRRSRLSALKIEQNRLPSFRGSYKMSILGKLVLHTTITAMHVYFFCPTGFSFAVVQLVKTVHVNTIC